MGENGAKDDDDDDDMCADIIFAYPTATDDISETFLRPDEDGKKGRGGKVDLPK